MTEQHTLPWESGQSAAPLPPLVDLSDVAQEEQPLVSLYRTYGPVFRFPQPGQAPQIMLAGPEINTFMARHEDAFFTTGEQWEQFDAMISQRPKSGMTEARDGEANRRRRAQSSRHWSRARLLDQIPQKPFRIDWLLQGWALRVPTSDRSCTCACGSIKKGEVSCLSTR